MFGFLRSLFGKKPNKQCPDICCGGKMYHQKWVNGGCELVLPAFKDGCDPGAEHCDDDMLFALKGGGQKGAAGDKA